MPKLFGTNQKGKLALYFKEIKEQKRSQYTLIAAIALVIIFMSLFFLSLNENNYNKTIAKITAITEKEGGSDESSGYVKHQDITATIMNGSHKGEVITLQNSASSSQANDLNFKVNDEVFVSFQENNQHQIRSSMISDFKRDQYIALISTLFILLILLVGGLKGFRSLMSVIINVVIISIVIQLYLHGYNLLPTSIAASILLIILSLLLVSGVNKKTVSAIVSTMGSTLICIFIATAVILTTHAQGIHYEEMEFLTTPPEEVFLAEVLIGTVGAIMDIAISISSSSQEIFDKNPCVEKKVLFNSGLEIGKDIMGTMANTLVFAYLSGSIPIILLWLKNGFSIFYIVKINISLEIIRALTGSIGIVISIPITLLISVALLKNSKIGEVLKS